MSLPPKSDSDEARSDETEPKTRGAKKTPRASTGVKRVRTRKKTKAEEKDSESSAPAAQESGELFPVAETRAPAPVQESRPEPVREPAREPAPEVRSETPVDLPEERIFRPRHREEAPAPQAPVAQDSSPSDTGSDRGSEPAQADNDHSSQSSEASQQNEGSSSEGGQGAGQNEGNDAPQYQQGGQGGQGGQQGGRVIKDRNYWKNLKKEKKKWKQQQRDSGGQGGQGSQGGQQGGQGGGGHHHQPRHEKHPPQPPPPTFSAPLGDLPDPTRFSNVEALDVLAADMRAQAQGDTIFLDELFDGTQAELIAFARLLGVPVEGAPPPRRVLLGKIIMAATAAKRVIRDRGWLDLTDRGHGFIVHSRVNYRLYPENTYVPEALIRRYGLKRGHEVSVIVQAPQADNERCCSVIAIESAMGTPPTDIASITPFEELTPYYPLKRILVEAPEVHVKDVSMRAVDILTPIGFGQRGLIVAPPRTGKTVLLHNIANSISTNYPEAKLIILLVDERPEEVTDFKRHTKGEVVSSTFDEMPENHVHAAEMVSEKAKRLVEKGEHVIILLDSITRLARAYNALASNSGKIMSGGVEATALQKPKRFFGAARNIEGAGSLTILGTALIDTGSRMDEVIFEEFKGTGNMELHLDRGLSDKRIFPAVNIDRSGTRKEELIYHPEEIQRIYSLRRAMQGLGPIESMDMLIQRLKKTKTNAEFLIGLSRT